MASASLSTTHNTTEKKQPGLTATVIRNLRKSCQRQLLKILFHESRYLNDKTATETKKQSMITDKQDKYYKKVLKKWKKEEKITVHKGSWNKISFTKLSVKAKDTSTTGTGSTSGN